MKPYTEGKLSKLTIQENNTGNNNTAVGVNSLYNNTSNANNALNNAVSTLNTSISGEYSRAFDAENALDAAKCYEVNFFC